MVDFSQHVVRWGIATLVLAAMPMASASQQTIEPPRLDTAMVEEGLIAPAGPYRWSHTREGVLLASLEADPRELLNEYDEEFDFYYEFPKPVPLSDAEYSEELDPIDNQGLYSPTESDPKVNRYRSRAENKDSSLLGNFVVAPNPGNISMLMVVFAVLVVLWNAKQECR